MLANRLSEYIQACFSGIWIESHEHEDALREIAQLCHQESWAWASWDISRGLQHSGPATAEPTPASSDPLAALRALDALASPHSSALLVLTNFHRFLASAEIVQALVQQITTGKQNRTFVIVLAPVVQIPTELEKLFVVVEHELPDRQQLAEIARGIATAEGELPAGDPLEQVLDAASGLTRYEAEGAFSLSLVRHGQISRQSVWELKAGMLHKSGLLSLHREASGFSGLGGLTALKAFCKRSLVQSRRDDPRKRPRGVLLLGVPGVGKSAFCKALGAEVARPTLVLDVGALYGSLVGETERNIRQALRTIDAMQPAILLIDEVEKALGAAGSSATTDSGVSARLFGSFLTWLSDHESDVYVVASCNDISKLPAEFSRAERWDGVFFLDLPTPAEKSEIWRLYLEHFQLEATQRLPPDEAWTGAEIRACCRLAALLDLPLCEAGRTVVPVAVTAAETVERLRQWAAGRCLDAAAAGIYQNHRASPRRTSPAIDRN
jgi:hypothetical protein